MNDVHLLLDGPIAEISLDNPTCGNALTVAMLDRLAAHCDAVDSTEILRGNKTVEIQHNGLVYRLQATRLGKLILTK